MESSPNTYQPPPFDPKQFQDQPVQAGYGAAAYGWINQVRIFAILNAVQGVVEIPMGLLLSGVGVMFPTIIRMSEEEGRARGGQEPPPPEFLWGVAIFYFVIGALVLASGILRLVAAYKNYGFRGRTLGMVSMIMGMCTMLTCYCAPTAIGVLIYGLILFLNPAVRAAFDMVGKGYTVAQMLAAYNPYQQTYFQQPLPPSEQAPGGQKAGGERPFA